MENPYKEPLKKCILCGKRVDYKNIQVRYSFPSLYLILGVAPLLAIIEEDQVSFITGFV